jgi:hypothetical protein
MRLLSRQSKGQIGMDATLVVQLVSVFQQMLLQLSSAFTVPTFQTFVQLVQGWILTPGAGTVTGAIRTLGPAATKHWTVYQKFFYRAAWSLEQLCLLVLQRLIAPLLDTTVHLAIDDTTCGPRGRHVAYAGWFKDASAHAQKPVIHWSHNWLVVAVLLWSKTCPLLRLALPVLFALHRKKDDCDARHPHRTLPQLAHEQVVLVSQALPEHRLFVVTDGLYVNRDFFGKLPLNVVGVGRLRKDAALRTLPPEPPARKAGRKRLRGDRLPRLEQLAKQASAWREVQLRQQGRKVRRKIYGLTCQWYHVCRLRPVRVVIVRDPGGKVDDLYLVCNDPTVSDKVIAQEFLDRWGVEECIQEAKTLMGTERTRGWCARTVSRQAPLTMLVETLVKLWYDQHASGRQALLPPSLPWYPHKPHPSFRDMLSALRRCLWRGPIFNCHHERELNKILARLEYALCNAA